MHTYEGERERGEGGREEGRKGGRESERYVRWKECT
jgi:hypothetical protein